MGGGRLCRRVRSHVDIRGDPHSRRYSEAGIQSTAIEAGTPRDINIRRCALRARVAVGANVGLGRVGWCIVAVNRDAHDLGAHQCLRAAFTDGAKKGINCLRFAQRLNSLVAVTILMKKSALSSIIVIVVVAFFVSCAQKKETTTTTAASTTESTTAKKSTKKAGTSTAASTTSTKKKSSTSTEASPSPSGSPKKASAKKKSSTAEESPSPSASPSATP
jgi:hypothetical protein